VYAVLHRPQAALHHAQRCLEICRANEIGDFDLAFAYEALARAHAVAGDVDKGKAYLAQAEKAGANIEDENTREYVFSELAGVEALLA
jgi:hypothetical protein